MDNDDAGAHNRNKIKRCWWLVAVAVYVVVFVVVLFVVLLGRWLHVACCCCVVVGSNFPHGKSIIMLMGYSSPLV